MKFLKSLFGSQEPDNDARDSVEIEPGLEPAPMHVECFDCEGDGWHDDQPCGSCSDGVATVH